MAMAAGQVMNDVVRLETPRLQARPLHEADFAALLALHQDPRVMATLAPAGHPRGGMLDAAETRRYLKANLEHWRAHDLGLWLFRRRDGDDVVGRAGLKRARILGVSAIELAYAVRFEHWNAGYATEMATAVLRWGFAGKLLTEIVCFTATTNLASQRVMEKLGFRYERDFVHAGLPHVLYRLTASEWAGDPARQSRRGDFATEQPE